MTVKVPLKVNNYWLRQVLLYHYYKTPHSVHQIPHLRQSSLTVLSCFASTPFQTPITPIPIRRRPRNRLKSSPSRNRQPTKIAAHTYGWTMMHNYRWNSNGVFVKMIVDKTMVPRRNYLHTYFVWHKLVVYFPTRCITAGWWLPMGCLRLPRMVCLLVGW